MNKITLSSLIIIIVILLFHLFLFTALKSNKNSWITLEPMPIAKAGIEVAVVNGKIYVIDSGINYEYNPATDTWTTKTPMPTPRTRFGIAVVENKIYVIGGSTGGYTYTNVNEVYSPSTDTWETKTSMPTTRHAMDANVVDGKIYVIGGGQRLPHDDLDVNEVYDPETDTWTTKTPIPTEVWDYTSAVVDDKIYIIGGAVGLSLNQIYDTETDTWSTGASLPRGVDSAAAGATTGAMAPKRIYVIGGKQNLDAVNFNQVYNPEKDRWSIGTAMPTARYGHGVAVVNDTLYAIGGIEGWIGAPVSAANEQYTPFG